MESFDQSCVLSFPALRLRQKGIQFLKWRTFLVSILYQFDHPAGERRSEFADDAVSLFSQKRDQRGTGNAQHPGDVANAHGFYFHVQMTLDRCFLSLNKQCLTRWLPNTSKTCCQESNCEVISLSINIFISIRLHISTFNSNLVNILLPCKHKLYN